jgi:hypothetical protein
MYKVLDCLASPWMPVRVGRVVGLQTRKGFAQGYLELGGDEGIRLGDAETPVQSRDDAGAAEVLGFAAQLKNALQLGEQRGPQPRREELT